MRKGLLIGTAVVAIICFGVFSSAFGADIELAKKSTLEKILQRGELRVGFESGYVPFIMTNKKGKFIGFEMDYARRLAKAMGVKFVPINTAWDGIIPALMTDKFDIIMGGMTITQERNLKINFVDPFIVIGQAILVNKKLEGTVKSFKDLNDPKYILTSRLGTTGEQAIKKYIPKATYKAFESEAEAGLEVINGKADALVYDLPFIGFLYGSQGDFLNFLSNFLRQSRGDGFYDKVYDKWIIGSDWKKELK